MDSDLIVPAAILAFAAIFISDEYLMHEEYIASLHCAPIVKASTMEEAKKQIEINQKLAASTVLGIGE